MLEHTASAVAIIGSHAAIAHASGRLGLNVRSVPRPDHLVDSIPRLLTVTAAEIGKGEGTLVVDTMPGGVTSVAAYLEAVRAAGWTASDAAIKHGSTWVTAQKGDTTIHTFVGQATVDKVHECVLAPPAASATAVAQAFGLYQHTMGVAWRATGGATCHALIRSRFNSPIIRAGKDPIKRAQPRWHWAGAMRGKLLPASPLVWQATPARIKGCAKSFPFVHHLDIRAQYLAGMSATSFGWDPPEDWGSCLFDPDVQGYWKIRIMEYPKEPWKPDYIPRTRINSGKAIVTTPILAQMSNNQKFRYEVEDSMRFKKAGRYLRPVAESIRNARLVAAQKHPLVLEGIKQTYTHGIGLFAASGGSIERADWRDSIVDTVNANLARKIEAIPAKYRLIEVCHDSLWIASPDEDPSTIIATMCGKFIGNLRYEETVTMEEYMGRVKK